MTERRVLLVDTSRIFGEVLDELFREHDGVRLVGEVHRPADLRSAMCDTGANCMIVAASGSELPPECRELLDAVSGVKVLMLVEEGAAGFVWGLEPTWTHAGMMTSKRLMHAIGME